MTEAVPARFPVMSGVTIDRTILRLGVAVAIACLQLAAFIYRAPPSLPNLAASIVYVLWAFGALFPPRYGSIAFKAPGWARQMIEIAICGAMIMTGGPILLAFFAIAIALFVPDDYLAHMSPKRVRKALLAVVLILAALALGRRFQVTTLAIATHPLDVMTTALLLVAFAAALTGRKSDMSRRELDDELSYHVAFASKVPVERVLELIADRVAVPVALIFRASAEHDVSALTIEEGSVKAQAIDPDAGATLVAPGEQMQPFLFDTVSGRILCSDVRRIGVRASPTLAAAWNQAFAPGRGAAIPFAMGRAEGWLYVSTGRELSHRAFLDMRAMAAVIGAIVLRFERFDSWRERTLAEARLLASRDMHDSVLQTLAGLRMQLSSMVKTSGGGANEALNAQLQSLDAIVATEQQHLRSILQRSTQDAETAAELFSYLRARAYSQGRQWNMRCTVEVPDEALPVSEETAIECEFLLREAMANAAQHANAEHILVVISVSANTLLITLRTDTIGPNKRAGAGRGALRPVESRSLRQRVENLGGKAYLESVRSGEILSIQIPLERK